MEFRHLRYFVVLAQELHFGRAAKRLNISQPPLSLNIKQLENSLGVELLERNNHGVKLTPAGEKFRIAAHHLLDEASSAMQQARDIGSGLTSRIRIGFVGSMMFRQLPEKLLSFQKKFPHVQIELKELNSMTQIESFARRQIDLGFVHTTNIPQDLKQELFMSEQFVCCVPEKHSLARSKKFDASLLKDDPLIIFSQGASPDYYERVLNLCREINFNPIVLHEVRHWLSVVSLVSKGLGVALIPKSLIDANIAGVSFVKLPPSSILSEVFMLWNERKKPEVLNDLLAHFRAS